MDLHKSDDCSIWWKGCAEFLLHLNLQVESAVDKNKKLKNNAVV